MFLVEFYSYVNCLCSALVNIFEISVQISVPCILLLIIVLGDFNLFNIFFKLNISYYLNIQNLYIHENNTIFRIFLYFLYQYLISPFIHRCLFFSLPYNLLRHIFITLANANHTILSFQILCLPGLKLINIANIQIRSS